MNATIVTNINMVNTRERKHKKIYLDRFAANRCNENNKISKLLVTPLGGNEECRTYHYFARGDSSYPCWVSTNVVICIRLASHLIVIGSRDNYENKMKDFNCAISRGKELELLISVTKI